MSVEASHWSRENHPAAHLVATKVHAYFARHLEMAGEGPTPVAPLPEVAVIERVIDSAFWASLRREEGRSPKISLALVPPGQAGEPLTFESWLPLTPASLARLAPAVERPGIHLGVWRDDQGELGVWGTTRRLPPLCFVLEVVTSGLLVIKHRSDSFGKFVNVAVLEGEVRQPQRGRGHGHGSHLAMGERSDLFGYLYRSGTGGVPCRALQPGQSEKARKPDQGYGRGRADQERPFAPGRGEGRGVFRHICLPGRDMSMQTCYVRRWHGVSRARAILARTIEVTIQRRVRS